MESFGEQFLHKKDSKLHTSSEVEQEVERKKKRGEEVSQKPADKIFDWLKIIERTHISHRENLEVMKRLRDYYYKQYVIKSEDVPESYFDNQKRLAREQGHGDIEITKVLRNQSIDLITSDQRSTLDNWINYFTSPDADAYPMWAKYWVFTNMLKLSTYDKEKHQFGSRDRNTVAPFPDLNREALAYVVDLIIKTAKKEKIEAADENPELKQLLNNQSFSKLYAYAMEKVTPAKHSELLNVKGEWIKYNQGTDHIPLVESLQGYGTGWCTAGESTAKTQLENGDFYVYYSYDKDNKPTIPRVAIRMDGKNQIGEVRGIGPDQNLDPYVGDILKNKLKEFSDGPKYERKVDDMKQLTLIDNKNKLNQPLTKEELIFLYEIDKKIQGFGYETDPRIREILKERNNKKDLSAIFDVSELSIGTKKSDLFKKKTILYYGDIKLGHLLITPSTILPEIVVGSLSLRSTGESEEPKYPNIVTGNFVVSDIIFTSNLKLPEKIGGHLYLPGLSSAGGVKFPKSIGGSLDLSGLNSAEGLTLPESIGGDLSLRALTSAKGLKLPESIVGSLDLSSLNSAGGLKLPESIKGTLKLTGLTSDNDLELPESVGGDLYLDYLTSAKNLRFPESVGGGLYLRSLISAKDLKFPESIGQDLDLEALKSAEGVKFPKSINGSLNLPEMTSIDGLKLPEFVGSNLYLLNVVHMNETALPMVVSEKIFVFKLSKDEFNKIKKQRPNLTIFS